MTPDDPRARTAALMRELGHDFVAHDLDEEQLSVVAETVRGLSQMVRRGATRDRRARGDTGDYRRAVADASPGATHHQLLSDSIVSGGANPMGLGAELWREGDDACMRVTLGRAFEGAPARAHGGVIAALLDETMGLVNAMDGVPAYTVQLDITYLAPTPIDEPVTARAHASSREGRKITVEGEVRAGALVLARATGLFIAVDPQRFLTPEATAAGDHAGVPK